MAATESDLVNYSYEYWHFSYGDKYVSYWMGKDNAKKVAYYDSIKY